MLGYDMLMHDIKNEQIRDYAAHLYEGVTQRSVTPAELNAMICRLRSMAFGDTDEEDENGLSSRYVSESSISECCLYFMLQMIRFSVRTGRWTELADLVRGEFSAICEDEDDLEEWYEWYDEQMQGDPDAGDGTVLQHELLRHFSADRADVIMYVIFYLKNTCCCTLEELRAAQREELDQLTLEAAYGLVSRHTFETFCYLFLEQANDEERRQCVEANNAMQKAENWTDLLLGAARRGIWLDLWIDGEAMFPFSTYQMLLGCMP